MEVEEEGEEEGMNRSWQLGLAAASIVGILLFIIYKVVPMLHP